MKSVLIVADIKNWAFDKIYRNLKKYCKEWHVDVWYQFEKGNQNNNSDSWKKFDLIYYLCDFSPNYLIKKRIPKEKLILGIRSMVTHEFYNDNKLLNELIGTVATSNKLLYERFSGIHNNVVNLPGGVDTEIFSFVENYPNRIPIIGWSGSRDNFGNKYRGLDILKDACKKLGYIFNPALREVITRTEKEMVSYYHNEIDIYADISVGAGRQNGLFEASSTGKSVISSRVGIAEELIQDGINGILVDRNISSICNGLELACINRKEFGRNIRKEIERKWSWKIQAIEFEKVFNKCSLI